MTITKCDKCGKEETDTSNWSGFSKFDRENNITIRYDLCHDCFILIEKFIENE